MISAQQVIDIALDVAARRGRADDTIVLVGHDSVNRALLMQLIDQPLSAYWRIAQSPCCLNEIDVTDGKISVQRINETAYLEALAR